jgi:putative membrane protein insertion efficiency factor
MRYTCLAIIRFYRYCISPFMGRACRFEPTCSDYAAQAIDRFGVVRGSGLAVWRLLKCHPFHPGGFDPLKEECHASQKGIG